MADTEKKETVKAETEAKSEKPAKVKAESSKNADSSIDVEKAKAFLLKNVTLNLPVWALIIIGILALVAILD